MRTILCVSACFMLFGCGVSQKQLKQTSEILQKVIDLPCDQVKGYAVAIKAEVDKKIK